MKDLAEIAMFSDDVAAMVKFYKTLLGADPVAQSEGMAIFMSGNTKIFLHHTYEPKEGDLPPENHIAFDVEDVDAECEQLIAEGLSLETPPKDYYWGRSAYLRDPEGQLIELNTPIQSE